MSKKSGKWSRNIIQKRAAYPYCGCISSVSDKYERIQTDGYCIHRQMTTTCTNRFAFPHKYLKNLSRGNLQTSLLVKKCLFGFYRPTREFFHSYGDVTITAESVQILTYTRHSFISKGSSPCHTYCDTGHPFKFVIS